MDPLAQALLERDEARANARTLAEFVTSSPHIQIPDAMDPILAQSLEYPEINPEDLDAVRWGVALYKDGPARVFAKQDPRLTKLQPYETPGCDAKGWKYKTGDLITVGTKTCRLTVINDTCHVDDPHEGPYITAVAREI